MGISKKSSLVAKRSIEDYELFQKSATDISECKELMNKLLTLVENKHRADISDIESKYRNMQTIKPESWLSSYYQIAEAKTKQIQDQIREATRLSLQLRGSSMYLSVHSPHKSNHRSLNQTVDSVEINKRKMHSSRSKKEKPQTE